MAFQLTAQQHAAVYDRGGGLLVSAAAGSGKTRVLVERLLARVEAGADIDRFLVITYTRAAAAELRSRIVSELSDRLSRRPGDAFLRRQATLVYKAQISTIDAFCAQFLREEGHRLDLDRDFRLLDENEAQLLFEEALEEVMEARYETLEPGGDFALLVDTMSNGRDDSRLAQMVTDVRGRIQSHPDPAAWLREQEEVFALKGVSGVEETPWGALLLADVRRQAAYWTGQMEEAQSLCTGDAVLEKAYWGTLEVTRQDLLALEKAAGEGWDKALAASQIGFPRAGLSRNCEDPAALERVKALRERCKDRMKRLGALLGDPSAALLEDMAAVYPAVRGLFALVADVDKAFAALKNKRGVVDFSDLEHFTARLLVGEDGSPTELADRWSERFDEVMVDEYQDANAVQNALFEALSDGGRKLFMVGDVKQSIYRFRLADPTIFLEKYRSFKPWEEAEEGEPRRVLLSRNFRSRPQVLEGCNYVFRSLMSESFGEMAYTDEEALVPRDDPFPGPEEDYRVELDLLDCSTGEADSDKPKDPRDLQEARFVAGRIRSLLDEGLPVSDGEGGLRPLRAGDIVILLRSPGTVLHHYAGALSQRGIPWQAEGGGDFFAANEIQVALSLLRIVDNPRQDVALIAALRSPVFGFSADRLAQIRALAPKEDFYTALTRDGGEDSKAFLSGLNSLRSRAGDETCERLLWRIYDETNLLGVFSALEEGEEARANLLLLSQLARDFERGGHRGLFGFLTYLGRLEEADRDPALPSLSAVGEGVRIMSIHRSKGLEFPVVFLCGLARQLNRTDMNQPMLFHPRLGVGPKGLDLERMIEYPTLARRAVARQMEYELSAEELRLLYVAMTRAQDKLILSCALTRGREDIGRLLPSAGATVEPQALLDSVSPAQWLLLCALARPEARFLWEGGVPPAVEPGVDFGPPWEIRWVEGESFASLPVRRQETGAGERTVELDTAPFTWQYPHTGDVELPSKLTATQLKGRGLDEEAAEEAGASPAQPLQGPRFDRPRFAAEKLGLTPTQKGTAIHLAMQYLDFGRCSSLEAVAGELNRLVEEQFLTPQQVEAVEPEKIWSFFTSSLGRELTSSPTLRREFKFSILVPARQYFKEAGAEEQVLLQGVVDCYFEAADGVTVVDFKTDRVYGDVLLARAEEYRPQLEAYGQALSQVTGKPVAHKILWFFSEGRPVEL